MSNQTGAAPNARIAAIESLIRDRYFDALVLILRRDFPEIKDLAEEAAAEAVVRVVKRGSAVRIQTLRSYLFAIASNLMRKWSKRREFPAADPLAEDVSTEDGDSSAVVARRPTRRRLRQHSPSAEDQALRDVTWRIARELVSDWPNENVRTITLLFLEAAYLEEPLTLTAAAELAEEILGRGVSSAHVATWKQRGLRRLAEQIGAMDQEEVSA